MLSRYVPPEEFIEMWIKAYNSGLGQTWIAEQLNTTRQNVEGRAATMRKNGVKLPKLRRAQHYKTNPEEVERLNQMIDSTLSSSQ